MVIRDEFSFGNEERKEDEKKDFGLTDEDRARMQIVKNMHGPIPDRVVEFKLIKKYPQLLQPFMFMVIRIIQAFVTVFV